MAKKEDGRTASGPYRVRVGGVWYWVDPTVPRSAMESGDIVIVYPVSGDAVLAILQNGLKPEELPISGAIGFSSLEGERFQMPPDDIAALHLTAVDEVQ